MSFSEWFAITRMVFWVVLGIVVFVVEPTLKTSVALVILLSLYANFGTDLGQFTARKAQRHVDNEDRHAGT